MEHISFSQRKSDTSNDNVTHEYPTENKELAVKIIDVAERHPVANWIETGEGIAILQIISKYGRVINPDSEQPVTCVKNGDQVHVMPGERFALEGPMSVVVVTTPPELNDKADSVA
jgi:mannose-6-phosphate isomerase class I